MSISRHPVTDFFIETVQNATVTNNTLTLNGQMTRKEYLDFMKIAEILGLMWDKKRKCHTFDGDNLQEALEEVIAQGEVVDIKKLYQQYYTPEWLAKQAVQMAEIKDSDVVLEPSAGQGAILKEILDLAKNVFYCEIDEKNLEILHKDFPTAKQVGTDFLSFDGSVRPDKIVMNPPFTNSQDVKHILHAYSILATGGTLIAIASASITKRQGKLYDKLQDLHPEFTDIEEGAFSDSGTMVKTVFVKIRK